MDSRWCLTLVYWAVVSSLVSTTTTTTTTTDTIITTTLEPDQQDLNVTTVQPDDQQKEEGSNRFLGFGGGGIGVGGGNAFGTYDVAASSYVGGSSGYHHQQTYQNLPHGAVPHLQSHYTNYHPGQQQYNPYHNTIPGYGGHHGGHHSGHRGGYLLQPGDSCKYYCLWSTQRTPYCCDNSPSVTGFLCPEVRHEGCPGTNYRHSLLFCARDHDCQFGKKCCFDACIKSHVCKTPL
ncbi:hypothetical protein Pcinc_013422 [Petrolisthes cinctipes]|uniref:WAP domain-containing protein n=1 Tax=Petrolisthes cinctipes TaxID=88211 RepID=A0AAE1KSB9_PETCI|nr:hypothetical protein Pcinc_013422 [Petrolisthes cinctipes]